jgi:hypothetical protein
MAWNLQPEYPMNARNHACAVCSNDYPRPIPGSNRHERVAETGLFIDGEGEVCICESCIVDIATQLGMSRANTVLRLQNALESMHRSLEDTRALLGPIQAENEALRTALRVRDSD